MCWKKPQVVRPKKGGEKQGFFQEKNKDSETCRNMHTVEKNKETRRKKMKGRKCSAFLV